MSMSRGQSDSAALGPIPGRLPDSLFGKRGATEELRKGAGRLPDSLFRERRATKELKAPQTRVSRSRIREKNEGCLFLRQSDEQSRIGIVIAVMPMHRMAAHVWNPCVLSPLQTFASYQ